MVTLTSHRGVQFQNARKARCSIINYLIFYYYYNDYSVVGGPHVLYIYEIVNVRFFVALPLCVLLKKNKEGVNMEVEAVSVSNSRIPGGSSEVRYPQRVLVIKEVRRTSLSKSD